MKILKRPLKKLFLLLPLLRKLPGYKSQPIFLQKALAVTLLLTTLLTSSTVFYLFSPTFKGKAQAAWFDDNWAYRKAIPLTSVTGGGNKYVTVNTINSSDTTKFQADCGDLRFTKQNGELLPYYLVSGCGGASTTVHINYDTLSSTDQNLYMYYGNPSAPNGTVAADFSSAATATVGTLGSEEKAPTPLLYWRFDDATGTTAKDNSSNTNNGTLGGTTLPTWQTPDLCIAGPCAYFEGSTAKITGSKVVKNVQTVSFWVRPNSVSSPTLLDLDGGTHKISVSSGTISATGFTSPTIYVNGNVSSTLTANTWQLVTVTTATGFDTTATFTLGTDGTNYTKGFFDEFKLYNYARSSAQVSLDYNTKTRASAKGAGAAFGADPNANLANGLVGYWKMDEASWTQNCTATSVTDSSGNSNNGKSCPSTTGPTTTGAKFGNGGNFDNTNDYVEVADANSLDVTQLTLSAWVKLNTNVTGTRTVIQKSTTAGTDGYSMDINSGAIRFCAAGGCVSSTGTLTAATWAHIVATFDGTNTRLYLNGAQDTTATTVTSVPTNALVLRMGADSAGANLVNGVMDDTRVYNRALSAAEVAQLSNWAPGPVAYWNMEEGSGNTINDKSGNGNTSSAFTGNVAFAGGKYGKALTFDGNGDEVDIPETSSTDLGATTDSYTVMLWFKTTQNNAAEKYLLAKDTISSPTSSPFLLEFNSGNFVCFEHWRNVAPTHDNFACSTTTYNDGRWHHVAGVRNVATDLLSLYIDGVFIGSVTDTSTATTANNDPVRLGNGAAGGFDYSGSIDDVKIYNYARTPKQIISDMNAGHPAPGSPVGSAVGYWKFDEGYGTTANNSGSDGANSPATLNNMSTGPTTSGWTTAGKFGKAIAFDGTNDYVSVNSNPTALKITGDLTLSAWVNLRTNTATHDIIAKKGASGQFGYRLSTDTSGKLNMEVSGTGSDTRAATGSATLTTNTWYHVAGVYKAGTSITVYVNGVQDGQVTTVMPASIFNSTANVNIGAENTGASNLMAGAIDEPKIYSGALTASEIMVDRNRSASQVLGSLSDTSGLSGGSTASNSASAEYCIPGDTTTCTAPVGRWDLEEGSGTTTQDTSGNGNTGTLSNGPKWTTGKVGKGIKFTASSNQYVNAGSASSLDNLPAQGGGGMTIEAWVKPTTGGIFGGIVEKINTAAPDCTDGGWLFEIGDGNNLHFLECNTGLISDRSTLTEVATNVWQHVAVTWTGAVSPTTIRMYINGREAEYFGGATGTGSRADDNIPNLAIGCDAVGSAAECMDGIIDQVRVFNYIRTPAQIAYDYNRGGPVAHWKFDECQGTTANDSSGNGNTGTITIGATGSQTAVGTCTTVNTATAWYNGVTGKRNYSLNFDGTDDYDDVGRLTTSESAAAASWSFWVKPGTLATSQCLFCKRNNAATSQSWGIMTGSTDSSVIRAQVASSTTDQATYCESPTGALANGTWTFVTVVYDGSQAATSCSRIKIYVNGVLKTSTQTGTPPTTTTADTANARFAASSDGAQFFSGQLDDAKLFNYALTATQVKQLANDGAIRFGPNVGTP